MKNILCIDFLNLLYRSFYGLYSMRNSKNVHVGGIFAFIKFLYKFTDLYKIDSVIVFDDGRAIDKKKIDSNYKANRDSMPQELILQKEILIDYLNQIKIPVIKIDNYEADDLIYSFSQKFSKTNTIYIISSDKDLHPLLLLDNVFIIDCGKNVLLNREWLDKKYIENVTENKILLYYALCGDSSDNIIGIKGIGEKTAKKIIEQYDSLDELYLDNFNKIKLTSKLNTLLIEGKNDSYNSLALFKRNDVDEVLLKSYVDLDWNKNNFFFGNQILLDYECNSLMYKVKESIQSIKQEESVITEEKKEFIYAENLFTTKIVLTYEDYLELKQEIENASVIALDTETTSGDPRKTTIIGFSICTRKEVAWYVPLLLHGERYHLYDYSIGLIALINNKKTCVMHNALFDLHVISALNLGIPTHIFDTMLMAYIFKEIKIGLKELSFKIFNEKMYSFSQVMQFGNFKTFDEIEITRAGKYAATDARQTYLLYNHYQDLLQKEEYINFNALFKEVEMPLLNVLYSMENRGILCNKNLLIEEEIKYVSMLNELHEKIKNIAMQKNFLLNPMSNKQTSIFLYDILKLPSHGNNKKTDQASLLVIEHLHEIIPLILFYRSLKSNISHFTTGLLKYVEEDGRIHTHYQQFITQTGRISTINPNLQNIPRTNDIYKIRNAFHAKKDYLLFSFDYSQIELRVLAYFSKDPVLIQLFNEDQDIHNLTACMIFKKQKQDITEQERQIAKKINFSILYGQSAYALARDLKILVSQAKDYLIVFSSNYVGIFKWIEEVMANAKEKGFVLTLHGFKRLIPELQDKNKHIFNTGARIAVNTIIQGTAAEIMKKAMIQVHQYLQKEYCGNIVLQIHDELLIEISKKDADHHSMNIQKIMENIIDKQIKLKVNISFSQNWQ